MKRSIFWLILALGLWPVRANELSGGALDLTVPPEPHPERVESAALVHSLAQLQHRRYRAQNQGILVETLDGNRILAEFNSDETFNPASVMKIATSFLALERLGPDYQFETAVYGDSEIDLKKKVLKGNLYLVSDGSPVFGVREASSMARSLVRRGLRRVEGDLVVVGPFQISERYTLQKSADQVRRVLTRIGIAVRGKALLGTTTDIEAKILYLNHRSEKLREILWHQNAHSVNEIADRLGDLLGGPATIQQFLVERCGIEPDEIFVDRPSGLEYNRMTPSAGVKMLRSLHDWLESHSMKMQDIMPVAGLDEGTLAGRFTDPDFRGGILGKTGTNPSKDGGISALAGVLYLRDSGPVLYAIFNSHGNVRTYRRWQDNFLKSLIEENGGLSEYLPAHEDVSGLNLSWTPSEYWEGLAIEPVRRTTIRRSRVQSRRHSVGSARKSYKKQSS